MVTWFLLALLIGGVFWWSALIRRVIAWGRAIAPVPVRRQAEAVVTDDDEF